MELSNAKLQYTKNKRRLITQNIKLSMQVNNIRAQIDKFYYQESLHDQSLVESQLRPVMDEIKQQEKLIRKLKHQIQMYKLERAKDNVEYIVREEDQLKIMRKNQLKLLDEKNILLNRKADKKESLLKDLPYQTYEKGFLEKLTQVVHFNREQAAKITQIERQIRKYHLVKKAKDLPVEKPLDPNEVVKIEAQIHDKIDGKKNLQIQWKPHFEQLDTQFAHLLHQASKKKEEVLQLEREQKTWLIRISRIPEAEVVLKNKSRIGSVKISTKLRQKIADYIKEEEEKGVKKPSQEELKLQFAQQNLDDKKKQKQDKKAEQAKPKSTMPPPLPGQKKKDDKITQTLHNDKNITKKVEKQNTKAKTSVVIPKTNTDANTQVSIPPKKKKKTPKEDISPRMSKRQSLLEAQQEQQELRIWQKEKQGEEESPNASIKSTPKNSHNAKPGVLQMKQVGITTPFQNWQQGQ